MVLLTVLLGLIFLYVAIYVFYCLFLVFTKLFIHENKIPYNVQTTRFVIIIPAHNEEALLPTLLNSIKLQKYPIDLVETIVIADNCEDQTATICRNNNVTVLERFHSSKRGKGYALKWALESIDLSMYNAVLIIDADCIISGESLLYLDTLIQDGKNIVQCYNGIENSDDSWFTRLLDVSRAVSNEIFLPSKTYLGLSAPLMGTGMCFTTQILSKYGWDAFSVGEDWEFYAKLLLSGEIVHFNRDSRVLHRESQNLMQATSQRLRWSSGRFAIAYKYGLKLFVHGLREGNPIKIDGSLPLLLPNPSLGINITVAGLSLSFLLPNYPGFIIIVCYLIVLFLQIGIFIIGVFYTQKKLKKFLAIFIAPIFLIWKMVIDILSVIGVGRRKWIPTRRR
jgi:1,2-diacylglycerol 3-beta-glucosyltransferase